jgi:hypothetical protein
MRFSTTKWYPGIPGKQRVRGEVVVHGGKPGSCHAVCSSVFVDAV